MTAIETNGLTKHYGDIVALEDLNMTVETGTVHGFIGPNGAGKTTTIQLIVGLLSPTAGEVYVAGEPAHTTAAKEHLGYSPQEVAVYKSMTGRQNLVYLGQAAGMSRSAASERADELLDWLDLTEPANRRAGNYSGGMKRRLSLAQAMMHDPEVLILDEPTTGLDPTGRQAIMDALDSLAEEGLTVLVSSHVLAELEQYIDVVTVVHEGRHVLTDSARAVQETYGGEAFSVQTEDDERAASLLAESPVVQAVEADDDGIIVTTDDPDRFRRELQALLVEEGITLQSLSEEGTLQEAFADIIAPDEAVEGGDGA